MLADIGDSILSFDPTTLAVFGAALVAWTLMLGVSLKLAFKVTGADPPGYFSCLGYALLLPIVNAMITSVAYATVGPVFGLVGLLQLYIQIKILMAAGNCGGWQAFFSGIVHGLFSGLGTVAIAVAVLFSGVVDPEEVKGKVRSVASEVASEAQTGNGYATEFKSGGSFAPWKRGRTADGATVNPYFDQQ